MLRTRSFIAALVATIALGAGFVAQATDASAQTSPGVTYGCRSTATLRLGSRGDCVKFVQSVLTKRGFAKVAIDGRYGASTREGVKVLQREFGLKADGVVGRDTWRMVITCAGGCA